MADKLKENKQSDKYVLLERGRDFTLTALAEHLNTICGGKKSGGKYSAIDVQKYMERGHLPEYLGGCILTEFRDEGMGIKLIRISTDIHPAFVKDDKKKGAKGGK